MIPNLQNANGGASASIYPVRSIEFDDTDWSDLEPFGKAVADARLVLLGEQSHHDGAAFAAKARLVRYLHAECGFDVLAWESGTYSTHRTQLALQAGADLRTALDSGIHSVWNTTQVQPLVTYAAATNLSERPLRFCGFDLYFSGRSGVRARETFVRDILDWLEPLDGLVTAGDVDALEHLLRACELSEPEPAAHDRRGWTAACQSLGERLSARRTEGERLLGDTYFVARTSLRNLIDLAELTVWNRKNQNYSLEAQNHRDAVMGRNLIELVQDRFAGHRIIGWLATGHAARNLRVIEDGPDMCRDYVTMGEHAYRELSDQMYTVMFTTHHGRAGHMTIPFPPEGSMEAYLHGARHEHAFVDLHSVAKESPISGRITARPFGYQPMTARWHDVADGVFYSEEMFPEQAIKDC